MNKEILGEPMSLKTLDKVLEHYDAKYTCGIYKILSQNGKPMFGSEMSQNQILKIAEELSQVSGGAGLDILLITLWPDDELSGSLADIPERIKDKLNTYVPGQVYSVTGD